MAVVTSQVVAVTHLQVVDIPHREAATLLRVADIPHHRVDIKHLTVATNPRLPVTRLRAMHIKLPVVVMVFHRFL